MKFLDRLTLSLFAAFVATPALAQAPNAVVATVNGIAVRQSRIDDQMSQISEDLLKGHEQEVRRQVLDRVLDQELVAQEATRLKVEHDPDYQKQLELTKLQLQANAVIARYVKESLTDYALRQRYAAVKQNLGFPAVKAKHILVPTEAEAREILKTVTFQNFSAVAKARSKGPSADQGGDLGWFRKEAMIAEFAEVAFSSPVGKVANRPIKTGFGWHVLLIEDRNENYIPPFEQVEAQLRQEMAKEVVDGYLKLLREKATIVYLPPYKK
ncbi:MULTISPECIES: peptidylprolyl isomerase [unclassified Bradyrhizobium]|uniref:peptidylprolyl isomerase n=1 Tax=unclassified Bradyrhizobium TaxID=2631580 RepID=UPI001CD436DA|nr:MULTISPECIES: peptidylprolyl isomerase [unclassified Bradyrhizobium]MCA1425991.1 peptidylprolyl isomerase [Bradyrhizobium sp. NBAIM16]MCA1503352.1 peptidylprolyl isomerase [Bradyrhizobium sp. NBAIM02]